MRKDHLRWTPRLYVQHARKAWWIPGTFVMTRSDRVLATMAGAGRVRLLAMSRWMAWAVGERAGRLAEVGEIQDRAVRRWQLSLATAASSSALTSRKSEQSDEPAGAGERW